MPSGKLSYSRSTLILVVKMHNYLLLLNFSLQQKQLAFILGRQQLYLELNDEMDETDDMAEIMSNSHLNQHFLALGREVT